MCVVAIYRCFVLQVVHPKSDDQRKRLAEAVKHILLFRSLDQVSSFILAATRACLISLCLIEELERSAAGLSCSHKGFVCLAPANSVFSVSMLQSPSHPTSSMIDDLHLQINFYLPLPNFGQILLCVRFLFESTLSTTYEFYVFSQENMLDGFAEYLARLSDEL